MAKKEDDSISVSSSNSSNTENYSQLLEAFQETQEEANRLVLTNNRLKGLNNWLEKRVETLEEELEKLKIDFEILEKHYKNSSHMCDSLVCENCENLEKKVHYLVSVEAGGSFFPTKACYVFDEENGLSALKIVIGF